VVVFFFLIKKKEEARKEKEKKTTTISQFFFLVGGFYPPQQKKKKEKEVSFPLLFSFLPPTVHMVCVIIGNGFIDDPSAGSPTDTLLRLLLPLNDQV
jgi:hypothetical protein